MIIKLRINDKIYIYIYMCRCNDQNKYLYINH